MYDTTDRKRGPKGNKRNQTRTVVVVVMAMEIFVLLIVRTIGGKNMEHEQLNTLVS
jgi:hypothetical protein